MIPSKSREHHQIDEQEKPDWDYEETNARRKKKKTTVEISTI
jgi:hypothetical protein